MAGSLQKVGEEMTGSRISKEAGTRKKFATLHNNYYVTIEKAQSERKSLSICYSVGEGGREVGRKVGRKREGGKQDS